MSRPPPQPIFVHRGLEGGATSCAVVSTSNGSGILVGTGKGRCELYDSDTHVHIRTVYGLNDTFMYAVRNHAVIILGADGVPCVTLPTSHCGYCRTIAIGEWLNEQHYMRFWSRSLEVRKRRRHLKSSSSFNHFCRRFDLWRERSKATLPRGFFMRVSLFSEPIFCVASSSSSVACGSSKPPIVLLPVNDINGDRRKVSYPPCSRGVGSMAFSTSGKTLIAGFWDGSIRAFSVQKLTILLYLDLHTETISQMVWSKVNGEDRLIVGSMDE
ncbi:hypothetical protein COOONC_17466, partial [Cooperia oncophora]